MHSPAYAHRNVRALIMSGRSLGGERVISATCPHYAVRSLIPIMSGGRRPSVSMLGPNPRHFAGAPCASGSNLTLGARA